MYLTLISLIFLLATSVAHAQTWVHPGILNTKAQYDLMKQKVAAGEQPWLGAYEVACHYQGTAPTTAAQFSLGTGTHTAPTCASPTSAATPQVVSNGTLAAYTPLRVSVTNTPNPTTDTYQVCAYGVRQ